jgi:hypothetical protein
MGREILYIFVFVLGNLRVLFLHMFFFFSILNCLRPRLLGSVHLLVKFIGII